MDSLVGGMSEQQVAMKSCIYQNANMEGGLTDDQLKEYLQMDLSKDDIQDTFYTNRRQFSIDHKLGGNPEVSNDEVNNLVWQEFLWPRLILLLVIRNG